MRDVIVNGLFYYARAPELNDPFDCAPAVITRATPSQVQRFLAELAKRQTVGEGRAASRRALSLLRNGLKKIPIQDILATSSKQTLSSAGILSLSEKGDDLLMWPHYADSHQGICIRIDLHELLNTSPRQVPLPVEYMATRPVIDPILDGEGLSLEKAFLSKGEPWAYEKEWRIIYPDHFGPIGLPKSIVSGIILGARISDEDERMVRGWIAERGGHIDLFQAKFDGLSYKLNIDPI